MTSEFDAVQQRGVVLVSAHYKKDPGKSKEYVVPLEVQTFESPPAHVSVSIGLTHNLGNYESAQTKVSVTLPCYPEEIDEATDAAREKAEHYLGDLSEEINGSFRAFLTQRRRHG
jgi:hypothetical protein